MIFEKSNYLIKLKIKYLMEFKIFIFNYIHNYSIQFNSKSNHFFKQNSNLKYNETALYNAVIHENIEIVKLLLSNEHIDVNIKNILILTKFYEI